MTSEEQKIMKQAMRLATLLSRKTQSIDVVSTIYKELTRLAEQAKKEHPE